MLMQCPRCGGYFKIGSDDFEADDVFELWCPMCGMKSDSFFPNEVVELAKAKALNQFTGDFEKEIAEIGRSVSQQSFIKMTVSSRLDAEREGELLPAVDAYEEVSCRFCGRAEKIRPLPKYVGCYCSFCGERI